MANFVSCRSVPKTYDVVVTDSENSMFIRREGGKAHDMTTLFLEVAYFVSSGDIPELGTYVYRQRKSPIGRKRDRAGTGRILTKAAYFFSGCDLPEHVTEQNE